MAEKIFVGMSGGVDSSVAAALLLQQGKEVVGGYMKNWINEENVIGNCPWQQDIEDARKVADHLGIEFRVVNLMQEYRDKIVNYLLAGYQAGLTPNPDIMCNREMKFGLFLEYARAEGFDGVGTGHYARKIAHPDGTFGILEGVDKNKDQSYFLALLRQEQIASAHFPLGHLEKSEVRALAESLGLPNHAKKDSQGICFIGEVRMADFLKTFVPDNPGPIVDLEGRVLGRHDGLHLYTIGQKRGVGVASPVHATPYVVLEKRIATNELVMGFDRPDTPGLYTSRCLVGEISLTRNPLPLETPLEAKPRYRAARQAITLHQTPEQAQNNRMEVRFATPQRAIAPGQFCAFYQGEELLGGAVFLHTEDSHSPSEAETTAAL